LWVGKRELAQKSAICDHVLTAQQQNQTLTRLSLSTLMRRILLSVPHMGGRERLYANEAFDLNWVSTAGPNLPAFEEAFTRRLGLPCVCLASGTAAIHLGLRLLGVGPGDEVLCSTLTFAASANPIRYLGAEPAFVDSESGSWNMDPDLLGSALNDRALRNKLPKAVVVVHLYGQCADMDPILEVCKRFGVPVLEDAAEALGATYKGRPAGTMGEIAAFSFNGNKIITTAGGGMLVARDGQRVEKARFWSTQAKDPGIGFEHSEMGYNYRMSNVLAGIGRGQLEVLDLRVEQRRAISFRYRAAFAVLPGISFMPQAPYGLSTNWLSCFLIDPVEFGCSRDALIRSLDSAGVESRPVWKPMHLQRLFSDCESYGGAVSKDLHERGICLPSSSSLTPEDQAYVIRQVGAARRGIGAESDVGEDVASLV
jgi:pyridoxal phosphate-dependent aminotransferase EpsN